MTERRINSAMNRISSCRKDGYHLEALVRSYCLNAELLHFILSSAAPGLGEKNVKIRTLVKTLIKNGTIYPESRSIIQKRSLKSLQTWLKKMDSYFKELKSGMPGNPKPLLHESERIFSLLKISAAKIYAGRSRK